MRHRLAVILGLAVCAVLAGTRSFTAIAEWAGDADQNTLQGLGVAGAVPSESTFCRTLQRLGADVLDDLAGQRAARRPLGHRGPAALGDIDSDEDRSQVRTAAGPRVMAGLRKLAVAILRPWLASAAGVLVPLRRT